MIETNTIPEKNNAGEMEYHDDGKIMAIMRFASIQETMNTISIIPMSLIEIDDSVMSSSPVIIDER